MTTKHANDPLMNPVLLGSWLSKRRAIWQMDLMDAGKLATFASDRDVRFWRQHIEQLWKLGLLRADLVVSRENLKRNGLIEVGQDDRGNWLYADERKPRNRRAGWGNSFRKAARLPRTVRPMFHPFRYLVLYYLWQSLDLGISRVQMFVSSCYPDRLSHSINRFQEISSQPNYLQNIGQWNDVVTLVVATEPAMYPRLFDTIKRPPSISVEDFKQQIALHWAEVAEQYRGIGVGRLEEVRRDLCIAAEILDPNKNLHRLIRLGAEDLRLRLKGRIGGSLHLLTMAEMLRRATEEVFETTLPEEDDLGFGWGPLGWKKRLYGSNRLLDREANVANEFMRQFRLDYGVRVRWYVEGVTEYWALRSVFGGVHQSRIEIINLRGQVAQKNDLTFTESLEHDLEAGVFSIISVDGDRLDTVRMVRKAAAEDRICGLFFISNPDFEFGNFSLAELETVLWDLACEAGAEAEEYSALHDAILDATSGKTLLSKARRAVPALASVTKDRQWGERLMQFALAHPKREDGTERLIIEAIRAGDMCFHANYHWMRAHYRLDPNTGKPVEREHNASV